MHTYIHTQIHACMQTCLMRIQVFFPHGFIPSNNKLDFAEAPSQALKEDSAWLMSGGKWEPSEERTVKQEFTRWLKKCHAEYDMDIKFEMDGTKDPLYVESEDRTYYDKLTYGHVKYKLRQKVAITKGKPHIFGEILKIYREGKHSNEATSSGYIILKRYPLEAFGVDENVNSFSFPVTRLQCEKTLEGESQERNAKWQEKVESLGSMLPCEIFVTHGRTEKQDDRLHEGQRNVAPRCKENLVKAIDSSKQHLVTAGYKLPALDVVILNKLGKAVNGDVMTSQRLWGDNGGARSGRQTKKTLAVGLVIRCCVADEPEVFKNIFKGHGKLAGGEVHTDKQERQSADLSYSFNVISGCFDIAGTYELIFTVLNADIHDPVTTRSKEIVWKQTFVVSPGQTRIYYPEQLIFISSKILLCESVHVASSCSL